MEVFSKHPSWDADGPGSTFRSRFPEHAERAERLGFDLARRPTYNDIAPARMVLGYSPTYGLREMLKELAEWDGDGAGS